jgi:predicted nucleic acid-binding protein
MLLDTSGLLSLIDRREAHHDEARVLYAAATSRVTHSYVLAEFIPLCLARGVPRAITLAFSAELLDHPDITLIWVDAALHRAALTVLQVQRDKLYSLCDAVSFVLMNQRGLTEALTTDHHFEQAGFRRLLG